ncbi:acyl-CoA synthetase [Pseudonocardia sp. N23]|uniref:acyl-CoA synthetase n=1 Tax=Pseudonocardia sp. N23 TaxID=1987376 RepID=UPI000BFC3F78|nr:AMP-binding protein [Pseudonocardia sp. N23]GAY08112.1 acetyl-coenzyme A synthetase [Pseudonocardia sp. N23]
MVPDLTTTPGDPTVARPRPVIADLVRSATFNIAAEILDGAVAAGLGDRIALRTDTGSTTYAELADSVARAAGALAELGVAPHDRVLLRFDDVPALAVWLFAVQRIGAVPVPVYALARAGDLVYRANDAEVVAVVTAADLIDEVDRARPRFTSVRHLIAEPAAPDAAYLDAAELLATATPAAAAPTSPDDPAILLYTSGSTGEPKGCLHSHSDIAAGIDSWGAEGLRPEPEDVFAGPPPLPFALGYVYFLIVPLWAGASSVLSTEKSHDAMLRTIERHGVTVFTAASSYFGGLGERYRQCPEAYDVASLRKVVCGGEPLQEWIAVSFEETFGLPLIQYLGTTELLHVVITYGADEARRSGIIGRAMPGYDVSVRDPESLAALPPGRPGLLAIRGVTGTRYWRRPEMQAAAVHDGWSVFKDLVQIDDDGYIAYVGRTDDMIVSSGFNIPPAYVEGILATHPSVRQVACVGAPDPTGRRSTVVKAYISLRDGSPPSPELATELQDYFKSNGQPHMYPRIVEFLPQLPQTLTGKISRSDLTARSSSTSSSTGKAESNG